jgi:hypothetical protein
MVDDVYKASAELESAGVSFQKKPDEVSFPFPFLSFHLLLQLNCFFCFCLFFVPPFLAVFTPARAQGRMKGLAFALDPDGYWVEIVRRGGRE